MNEPLHIQVNNWRVFPRLFSIIYIILIFFIANWFMGISDPTAEQSAFATIIITSMAAWFKFYVRSGPDSPKE